MQKHKDVELASGMFRVERLLAQDGGWIAVLLTGKMRAEQSNAPKQTKRAAASKKASADAEAAGMNHEQAMMMMATFLIAQLSRAELADVQAMCLSRVFYEDELAFVPVMVDGRWTNPELEYDGPTILELTKHSLAFNIAPFFPAPASN